MSDAATRMVLNNGVTYEFKDSDLYDPFIAEILKCDKLRAIAQDGLDSFIKDDCADDDETLEDYLNWQLVDSSGGIAGMIEEYEPAWDRAHPDFNVLAAKGKLIKMEDHRKAYNDGDWTLEDVIEEECDCDACMGEGECGGICLCSNTTGAWIMNGETCMGCGAVMQAE